MIGALDISDWDPSDVEFVRALRSALSAVDPAGIEVLIDLARREPRRWDDPSLLREPAVFGLLVYGQRGLDALFDLATGDIATRPHPVLLRALLAVALHRPEVALYAIQESQQYLGSIEFEALRDAVVNTCTDHLLSLRAEQLLGRVVRAYLNNPLGHTLLGDLLGMGELYFGRYRGDAGAKFEAVAELVARLIAKNTLAIDDESCSELQGLIEGDLDERVYQEFLTIHPAILDPLAATIVPLQSLGEKWKTDFVIRRLDDQYVFVEIEKPKDMVFSSYPHPTMALSHALGQVLSWFVWVEDHIAYARENGFPGIHSPLGIVVIGRDRDLSAQQSRMLRALNDTLYPRITVRTFDELVRGARQVLNNLTSR